MALLSEQRIPQRLSVVSRAGREAVVATLGPGDFLGESALVGQRLCDGDGRRSDDGAGDREAEDAPGPARGALRVNQSLLSVVLHD